METSPQVLQHELNSNSFYADLAPIIQNAEKKATLVNQNLDSLTNIARSTIWRWAQGINKDLPDPYKVFALLRFESEKESVKDVATYYGGQIKSFLVKYFPAEFIVKKGLLNLDPANEPHFNDYISFVIFTMCGTGRKMTLSEVMKTIGVISLKGSLIPKEDWDDALIMAHGKIAERKINELVDAGYLKLDGNYVLRQKEQLNLNVVDKIDHISKNISTFFQLENVEKQINGLHFFYESVNPDYAKKLSRDIREFYAKKRDEASTNRDPNGIPIHTIFFTDSILFDSMNENPGRKLQ